MGATTDHALGRNLRFFCKEETTAGANYGTSSQEALAGGDAAKVLATTMDFTVARNDRMDARTSRSVLEKITGKQDVAWSCESYLLPAGTKVMPDVAPLLRAVFGTGTTSTLSAADSSEVCATITAATKASNAVITFGGGHPFRVNDQVYFENVTGMTELNGTQGRVVSIATNAVTFDIDSQTFGTWGSGGSDHARLLSYRVSDVNDLPTVRMMRTANGVFREDLFGCWVEEFGISASGGDEPKITFSGGAFNYALTGTGNTHGSSSPSSTSVPLVTGDGVNFMVGSCVDINTGSAIVTAKAAADTLTVTSGSYATGEAVTPETYTETTAGSPVNGIGGSLTLNGVTLPITAFDVTVTNGLKPLSDEAFTKGTSDFIAGYRATSGNVSFRARKDFIKSLAQRYVQLGATANPSFASVPIVVTLGSATGLKVLVRIPTCELNFAGLSVPEAEEVVISVPFVALNTPAADGSNQEIIVSFNQ